MSKMNLQPKVQEILIKNPKEKGVFCETFVYEPENVEELRLGNLYIIGQMQKVSVDSSHLINLLASIIKREYYLKPLRGPLNSLEEAFKKANSALSDLAKTGNLDWLGKINFISAVLAKKTSLATPQASQSQELYLHATKVGQAKILLLRENRLTDISKKLIPSQEKVHPNKVFQSIVSGKLFLNDRLVLIASDLSNYISLSGLKQILAFDKIEQIEKIIKEKENFSSQGMIVIKIVPEEKPALAFPAPIISAPTSTTKNLFGVLWGKKEILRNWLKQLTWLGKIKNKLFKEMKFIASNISFLISERFGKKKFSLWIEKEKKILLAILILFIGAISAFSLIYYQKYQPSSEIENQIQEKSDKITRLEKPNLILDFKELGFDFTPKNILVLNENLLLIDPNSNAIYKLNSSLLKEGKKEGNFILTNLPKNKNWLSSAIFKENLIILFSPSKEFYQYNLLKKNASLLSLILPYKEIKIKDISTYLDNLYLLDLENNQIIKCPNLTNCQLWLKEKQNLSQAISLTIDGSIYILNSDGSIVRYLNGYKKEDLKPQALFQSEIKTGQILTKTDFKNLYLLDTGNKRLIIFDKKGQLVKQYICQEFSDLTSFGVTDDEKTVFVLDGTKLYQLDN